jgi:hypothetical protein
MMKNMRAIIPVLAAAVLASAMTLSAAQSGGGGDQEKGSTGWSGGAKDQPDQKAGTTGQKVEVHDDALAKGQPDMATGEDLKGPPQQFAPSKTPE